MHVVAVIAAVTAASFFLNAVFAFATVGPPEIRPAMTRAWSHRGVILAWGVGIRDRSDREPSLEPR